VAPDIGDTVVADAADRYSRFSDRIVLVTGGGRGIGRAIALAMAAEGAYVAIVARSVEQCEAVASEIGERAIAVPGDVSDSESCSSVVATVTARLGQPSVLINAAGISPVWGPAERQDVGAFADVIAVNLVGAFTMSRAASESLCATRGAVVNVSSALGVAASPMLSAYGASKAALIQLTRTLAREWAAHGVRVNALCPGYIETELTTRLLAKRSALESILEQTPMRRLAEMHEVVAPALFLASDEAAYITGAALLVDGGFAA
jgi:NAD(P)-dependent dehydrogenase (short-subunit alcohol dehydrogenase family)